MAKEKIENCADRVTVKLTALICLTIVSVTALIGILFGEFGLALYGVAVLGFMGHGW